MYMKTKESIFRQAHHENANHPFYHNQDHPHLIIDNFIFA